ncbi:MAG: pyridoxal-phosphate dependent enzyme [Chloroflexi bacterium OHK40]
MAHPQRISVERIARAMEVIDPVFLNTPQYVAESLGALLGCRLLVKVETVNPIRSFKGRGAELLCAGMEAGAQVVCASAGNFGQGMAFAARKRGLELTVFAATNANPLKVARMRALGAEVRLEGDDFDAAKQAARAYAEGAGARFVEDSRDVETAEGAGTIGLELLRWPEPLDALLVPLGNGALLAGVAHWVKAHSPRTEVIGVSAAGAPAMERSWRAGSLITTERAETIADGIAVRVPVPEALADLSGVVDEVILVDDEGLVKGMGLAHTHLGLVLEPSGVCGVAALLANPERFAGRLVASILCGGNLTPEQMIRWLATG